MPFRQIKDWRSEDRRGIFVAMRANQTSVPACWALAIALTFLAGCGSDLADVARVTPQQLQQALAAGTAVVVDVRGTTTYDKGHIQGAIDMPLGEVASRIGELPKDKQVVFYCS